MKIKFKKIHPLSELPKRSTELAGGWDVVCTDIVQEDSDLVICKLGFALQPPINYKITLVPRSSITKTRWLVQNSPGLGDPDFFGEYQFRFRAIPDGVEENQPVFEDGKLISSAESNVLTYPDFPYKIGDRVGQIYIEEIVPIEFEIVNAINSSERREGWGSSGL